MLFRSASSKLKQAAHALIDHLPEHATWRDVACQAATRAEAEEGLADIEAGRVVDGDQVLRWIDSWGTAQECDAPQPQSR